MFSILLLLGLSWGDLLSARAQLIMVPKTRRYAPNRNPAPPPPAPKPEEPKSQTITNITNTVVAVTNRPKLVRIEPKPDPAKVAAEKETVLKNTVEWERSRANEGSAWAQYKLGVRYLNGDGVEKNETTARKWLRSAAENGESQAANRLKILDSKENNAGNSKLEAAQ